VGGGVVLALYHRGMMASVVGAGALPSRVESQDRVALTFSVDSVDAAYDALTAMGVKFLGPPSDKPEWLLRVVHLRDPAGNLIEFNAPLGIARLEEEEAG
jgi:predicted enzyme related to lactoylglutathione lyase